MKILSIETSCDETAVSIVEASGGLEKPVFTILGSSLFSQIELHKEYGGVFPTLAKREHAKNLTPLLVKTLQEAKLLEYNTESKLPSDIATDTWTEIENILEKEHGLFEIFKTTLENISRPQVDVIAVTSGPGLEPALWVGISFARALLKLWDIPVIGVNHMEGHITSVLLKTEELKISIPPLLTSHVLPLASTSIQFPALALLISGGHTELVEIKTWGQYSIIGQTRDDAVGEAFDKVARLLGLPYPGGPEISRLAQTARQNQIPHTVTLPRPMIHSGDLDFSFSGLKTAVLYYIRDHGELSENDKLNIAREFEDAVVDVLLTKTKEALEQTGAQTLIIAGGVIANKKIKHEFGLLTHTYTDLTVLVPETTFSTDNSTMIASAGYIQVLLYPDLLTSQRQIIAEGNLAFPKSS